MTVIYFWKSYILFPTTPRLIFCYTHILKRKMEFKFSIFFFPHNVSLIFSISLEQHQNITWKDISQEKKNTFSLKKKKNESIVFCQLLFIKRINSFELMLISYCSVRCLLLDYELIKKKKKFAHKMKKLTQNSNSIYFSKCPLVFLS